MRVNVTRNQQNPAHVTYMGRGCFITTKRLIDKRTHGFGDLLNEDGFLAMGGA